MVQPRIVLRRGVLSPVTGKGEQAAPASGATITIWDSTANFGDAAAGFPPYGAEYRRLLLDLYSSHASATGGVIFEGSADGTNWDFSEVYDLAATTATVVNYHVRTPHVRVRYTNSANTLTGWRMSLVGDTASADPGQ